MKKITLGALVCSAVISLAVLTACGGKNISVTNAVMRPTFGSSMMSVLYMDVTNNGKTDDGIVSVKLVGAGSVEAHESVMDDHNVMQMRPLPSPVPLPAGQTVQFKPLQKHFMVMDLTQKMKEGDHLDATITFQHAAPLTVPVEVKTVP